MVSLAASGCLSTQYGTEHCHLYQPSPRVLVDSASQLVDDKVVDFVSVIVVRRQDGTVDVEALVRQVRKYAVYTLCMQY